MNHTELKLNIDIAAMSYRKLQEELRHLKEIGWSNIKLNSKRAVLASEYKRIMMIGHEEKRAPKQTFNEQVEIFAELTDTTATNIYQLMSDPISLKEAIEIMSYELDIEPYQLECKIGDTFDVCELNDYLNDKEVNLHYFLREMAEMTEEEVIAECEARNAITYAEIAKAYGIAA
jgi:site-specific DNA-cytosine methylase